MGKVYESLKLPPNEQVPGDFCSFDPPDKVGFQQTIHQRIDGKPGSMLVRGGTIMEESGPMVQEHPAIVGTVSSIQLDKRGHPVFDKEGNPVTISEGTGNTRDNAKRAPNTDRAEKIIKDVAEGCKQAVLNHSKPSGP